MPEARKAVVAGQHLPDLGYDRGKLVTGDTPMTVVVPVRPADTAAPGMPEGYSLKPAREMDAAGAQFALANAIANLKRWTADFPYRATGENAEMLRFLNRLRMRQQARLDAASHGGVPPADEADYSQSPEGQLAELKSWFGEVLDALEITMAAADVKLPADTEANVLALRTAINLFEI